MPIVKASSKCQIVIPSKLRKEMGIEPGKMVLIEKFDENHILLSAIPDDPIRSLRGAVQSVKSLAQELLDERKEDNLREENKAT